MEEIKFGKPEQFLINHFRPVCVPIPVTGCRVDHPYLAELDLHIAIFKRALSGNNKWRSCEYFSGD